MNLGLAIAGVGCFLLAVGHSTIGMVWVLPRLARENVPGTPIGPPSMTLSMLRVSWHVVTIFCLGLGTLFTTLALDAAQNPKTLLLRCFAVIWLAVTAMTFWIARRRPLQVLRLPVPLVWIAIALLLWRASL